MAKYSRNEKMARNAQVVGIEKFEKYYKPRYVGGLRVDENSYGLYKVVHEGKVSERECMRAWHVREVNGDEEIVDCGWIINMHNRQRTYKATGSGYEVFPLKK